MIIARYLRKEIFTTLVANTVILLLIFVSNQFVHYLHIAATGKISSKALTLFITLQLPLLLNLLLPLSLFLSILVSYGRLYADSEMTVLFASGFSMAKLIKVTLYFSLGVVILTGVLSLWIDPIIYNYSDQIIAGKTSSSIELLFPNKFQSINDDKWVFYVGQSSVDSTQLNGIFAAELPSSKESWGIVSAKSGYQRTDLKTNESFLILNDGFRYSGTPGKNDYRIVKYKEYGVRLQKVNATVWQQEDGDKSTLALWKDRQDKNMAAELQWRIALPISTLILALIGTLLSKVKTKRGRYAQIVPAILVYIIYVQLLFLNRAWLKKGIISVNFSMYWVHLLMLLIASILIINWIGWRRVLYKAVNLIK
jgi:lipopolysaccharide export system permease protein